MNQAEELLRVIVRHAVEAESIPVPAIWRERIVELCVRVVHKLIGCDRAVVALCAEFVRDAGQRNAQVKAAAARGCADGGILDGTNRTTSGAIGQP